MCMARRPLQQAALPDNYRLYTYAIGHVYIYSVTGGSFRICT